MKLACAIAALLLLISSACKKSGSDSATGQPASTSTVTQSAPAREVPRNLTGRAALMTVEVPQYRDALRELEWGNERRSIEPLHAQAQAICRRLLAPAGVMNLLESLDQSDYDELEKNLKGVSFTRYEVVVAEPDAKFFQDLAERKGLDADREFFETMRELGQFPAYFERLTDVTACVKYGEGHTVRLYGALRRFRQRHPDAYAETLSRQMEKIPDDLSRAGACGSKEAALAELRQFIRSYPDTPAAAKLKEFVQSIESGSRDFAFDLAR